MANENEDAINDGRNAGQGQQGQSANRNQGMPGKAAEKPGTEREDDPNETLETEESRERNPSQTDKSGSCGCA